MNTAWTHDDILINLTDEVTEVKRFYGVPHLDHVPNFELTPLRHAVAGDLVQLKNGAVGIVFDVVEEYGQRVLAIVVNSGRVITKRAL